MKQGQTRCSWQPVTSVNRWAQTESAIRRSSLFVAQRSCPQYEMTTHDATGAPLVLHLHLAPANFATACLSIDLLTTRFLIYDAPAICASASVNCLHPQTPSRFLEGGFGCGMTHHDTKQTDSCRFLPKRENPDLHGAANALRERQFHARNCCRKSHSKSCSERSVGSSPTTGTIPLTIHPGPVRRHR